MALHAASVSPGIWLSGPSAGVIVQQPLGADCHGTADIDPLIFPLDCPALATFGGVVFDFLGAERLGFFAVVLAEDFDGLFIEHSPTCHGNGAKYNAPSQTTIDWVSQRDGQ
jgi:hypothetical protein